MRFKLPFSDNTDDEAPSEDFNRNKGPERTESSDSENIISQKSTQDNLPVTVSDIEF